MFWAKTLKVATFCASLFEFCWEEELEDEDWLEEELLPVLLEELEAEDEPWLEDELEGVLPELEPPDIATVTAVAATTTGVTTYLRKKRHIGKLL